MYLDKLEVLFCSKHGLWSGSFCKEYLTVLSYLEDFLHLGVILVWMNFGYFVFKGLSFIYRFAIVAVYLKSNLKGGILGES